MHASAALAEFRPRVSLRPSAKRPMPKLDGEAWLACLTNLSPDQLDRPHLWPMKPASSDLQRVREALVEALKPAPASATMAHVEFLRSRYRARPAEPAHLADADARLWIEALAHWPADVAEAACYAWMVAEKPFPPSVPGELLPYGDPIMARRSALLWRVGRMIAALPRANDDPEPEHSFGRTLRALAAQVRGALALGSRARPCRVHIPLPSGGRAGRRGAPLDNCVGSSAPSAANVADGDPFCPPPPPCPPPSPSRLAARRIDTVGIASDPDRAGGCDSADGAPQ